jgi:hypothetical protein
LPSGGSSVPDVIDRGVVPLREEHDGGGRVLYFLHEVVSPTRLRVLDGVDDVKHDESGSPIIGLEPDDASQALDHLSA